MSIVLMHQFEAEAARARVWSKAWKRAAHSYRLKYSKEKMRCWKEMVKKDKYCNEVDALKAKIEALPGLVDGWFGHAPGAVSEAIKVSIREHFGEGK